MAFQPRIVISNKEPRTAQTFRTHGTPHEAVLEPGEPYFGRKLCSPDATCLTPVAWEAPEEAGRWHIGVLREEWQDGISYLQTPPAHIDLRLLETVEGETSARGRINYLGQSMLFSKLQELRENARPVICDNGALPFPLPVYRGAERIGTTLGKKPAHLAVV